MGFLQKMFPDSYPKVTKYPSSSVISNDLKRLGINQNTKVETKNIKPDAEKIAKDLLWNYVNKRG